jgi:signal transduction histidine kinase
VKQAARICRESSASSAGSPVIVSAHGLPRYRPEVESAVYFTCLAGIDNAAKHAGPAEVSVRVWETDEELHFSVCDTGCGFDPRRMPAGAGLTNTRDRVTALGGKLDMKSKPSNGTRIHGSVPDPWPVVAAPGQPPATRASSPGARLGLVGG